MSSLFSTSVGLASRDEGVQRQKIDIGELSRQYREFVKAGASGISGLVAMLNDYNCDDLMRAISRSNEKAPEKLSIPADQAAIIAPTRYIQAQISKLSPGKLKSQLEASTQFLAASMDNNAEAMDRAFGLIAESLYVGPSASLAESYRLQRPSEFVRDHGESDLAQFISGALSVDENFKTRYEDSSAALRTVRTYSERVTQIKSHRVRAFLQNGLDFLTASAIGDQKAMAAGFDKLANTVTTVESQGGLARFAEEGTVVVESDGIDVGNSIIDSIKMNRHYQRYQAQRASEVAATNSAISTFLARQVSA